MSSYVDLTEKSMTVSINTNNQSLQSFTIKYQAFMTIDVEGQRF